MEPKLHTFRRSIHLLILLLFTVTFNAKGQCPEPEGINVYDITATTVKIKWSAVISAHGYEYAIGTDTMLPQQGTFTTSVFISLQGLSPDKKYCAYIRSRCSTGTSPWVTVCFTTSCSGINVANVVADNVTSYSARITWEPFSIGSGYEYSINQSAVPPLNGTPTQSNFVIIQGLNPNQYYCMHVRALCPVSNTYTDWATTCFTTDPYPSTVSNTNSLYAYGFYPNPVQNILNINIPGLNSEHNLIITDRVGKIVSRQTVENEISEIDLSSITPGIYFIVLSGPNINTVQKIVKE